MMTGTIDRTKGWALPRSCPLEKVTTCDGHGQAGLALQARGFIFPSSEIYGGINGFWDYGPLGVELKRNIKDAWWRQVTTSPGLRDDMVGLDCSIIMNPKVWEASGHVGGFSDPMVDCRETKERYRADQLYVFAYVFAGGQSQGRADRGLARRSGRLARGGSPSTPEKKAAKLGQAIRPADRSRRSSPTCSSRRTDREKVDRPLDRRAAAPDRARAFNLMFKTYVGALEDESNVAYLRPETAQGIFANFRNVVDTGRVKLPFGIAQVGKSFRNEINPRNFTFRSREFEQMEIEFFCHPDEADGVVHVLAEDTGSSGTSTSACKSDRLRLRDHDPEELAFYSTATADIEYAFPFGISELEGIAHRGDYDLNQHMKFSGKDLSYFDEEQRKERLPCPHVDRAVARRPTARTLAFLCEAYTGGRGRRRVADGAEVPSADRADQGGGFPAGEAGRHARDGREDLPRPEAALQRLLSTRRARSAGAIAARTRRARRSASPSTARRLTDDTVTFRDRDSCRQWRVAAGGASQALDDLLEGRPVPEAS